MKDIGFAHALVAVMFSGPVSGIVIPVAMDWNFETGILVFLAASALSFTLPFVFLVIDKVNRGVSTETIRFRSIPVLGQGTSTSGIVTTTTTRYNLAEVLEHSVVVDAFEANGGRGGLFGMLLGAIAGAILGMYVPYGSDVTRYVVNISSCAILGGWGVWIGFIWLTKDRAIWREIARTRGSTKSIAFVRHEDWEKFLEQLS